MTRQEISKRRAISRLMREAATVFSNLPAPEMAPALPKLEAAVELALELEDKTPLIICLTNLASMNAMCGNREEALRHIEDALTEVSRRDLGVSVRDFACTKFVEIAILLKVQEERAQAYARALVQSAADEEGNYHQFLASLFNLAVLSKDLLDRTDWAVAILSWIVDEARPGDHPIAQQARKQYTRIAATFPARVRYAALSEIECNRDLHLEEATAGFLPDSAPPPAEDDPSDASETPGESPPE